MIEQSPRILVIGSINVDLVGTGDRLPRPGETLNGISFARFFGGKGANQAVAASRAGAQVDFLGAVGSDDLGKAALVSLNEAGVNTDLCRVVENETTGVALILIGEQAENSILIIPGANGTIAPEQLETIDWATYDCVVLQLEIPEETVAAAIEKAFVHTRVVLTPAPAVKLSEELLKKVDVIIPNQHELEILAGKESFQDAINRLRELPRSGIALTLGADGVRWLSASEDFIQPAFDILPVVDTVGAGDCFAGFFSASWAGGYSVQESLLRASVAGSIKVGRKGAQGMVTAAEVEAYIAANLN